MTGAADPPDLILPGALEAAIADLDRYCRERLNEEEADDRVLVPLYHYTGAAGLKGIFETRQMWFTDHRRLNDPGELRYGVSLVHEALRAALEGADARVDLFLRFTADLFSHENLGALAFFVSSFSRARNDLGQWRAYADNGRGFAIGYAPSMFEVLPQPKASPDENTFLSSVRYDAEAALRRSRLTIDAAASIFLDTADAHEALLRDNRAVGVEYMRRFGLTLVASALIWHALTTKHPAYGREEEVRLLIMGASPVLQPFTKTRVRGGEIVPYIAHPWVIRGPDDVAEIVIGPAAPPDTERTLRTLLANCGLPDVRIERSDIPYRAL